MNNEFLSNFTYKDGLLYLNSKPDKELGKAHKGDVYKKFRFGGKLYYVHRVVYSLFNGQIPKGMNIDHINRNKADNRIENLRLVSVQQNSINTGRHKDNRSGIKNVSWHEAAKKWNVRLRRKGINVVNVFCEDLELAELVAQEAEDKFSKLYQ